MLFSDLVDSTALGERMDPELLNLVLTRFYEEARRVLERYGGTVEKFIGDAVVGVFGLPMLHEDDALRAVSAAVALRSALRALNRELEQDRNLRLRLRTAVNTGEVVTGHDTVAGGPTVLGDAVNVAARLQNEADADEILIGDATYQLVRDEVEVEPMSSLALRGRESPVTTWRLRAIDPTRRSSRPRGATPLVGRERELDLLRLVYRRSVANRSRHVAVILGEAGVGKSRLVAELDHLIGEQAPVLYGKCRPYGDELQYGPVLQIVRQAAGILPDDAMATAEARLAMLGMHDERVVARVAQFMGLRHGSGEPEDTHWALRRLFEMLAARGPLILVFEDLHYAQPTLLNFLRSVVLWLRDKPALFVLLARLEVIEGADWLSPLTDVLTMQLTPLDPADSGQAMVEYLLGAPGLTLEDRQQIAEHAGGNPLFIEELVADLTEARVLSDVDGRWEVKGDLGEMRATPRIDAVLAARLDRLDREEYEVIERAAVIGAQFRVSEIAALLPSTSEREVATSLTALVRKELFTAVGAGTGEDRAFRFRHALIHDAAYQTIPKERRAELHESYVDWLEQEAGRREHLPQRDEILGLHLREACRYWAELGRADAWMRRLRRRAGTKLAAAGHRRLQFGDETMRAAELLTQALEYLHDDGHDRRAAQLDLAEAYHEAGERARAVEVYDDVHEAAMSAGDRAHATQAALGRLESRSDDDREGVLRDGSATAAEACSTFEDAGDMPNLAKAWRFRAFIEAAAGRSAAARRAAERAISSARRAGDERLEGRCRRLYCYILDWGATPLAEVIRHSEEAHAWAVSRGVRGLEKDSLNILARAAAMQGDVGRARQRLDDIKAIQVESEIDAFFGRPWIADSLAAAYVELLAGQPEEAERKLRQAEHKRQTSSRHSRANPIVLAMLAQTLVLQDRYDEAARVTEECERVAPASQIEAQIRWRQIRAVARAGLGDHAEAERLAWEALALVGNSEQIQSRAGVLADLADVLQLGGRPDEALVHAQQAAALYRQKGNEVMAARVQRAIDGLRQQAG